MAGMLPTFTLVVTTKDQQWQWSRVEITYLEDTPSNTGKIVSTCITKNAPPGQEARRGTCLALASYAGVFSVVTLKTPAREASLALDLSSFWKLEKKKGALLYFKEIDFYDKMSPDKCWNSLSKLYIFSRFPESLLLDPLVVTRDFGVCIFCLVYDKSLATTLPTDTDCKETCPTAHNNKARASLCNKRKS